MSGLRRLWRMVCICVGPADPLRRPVFPANERLTAVRGSVDDVKPLYGPRSKGRGRAEQKRVNYEELPIG